MMADRKALIVGVTGTTGYTTAHHLLDAGWEVHGLSRRSVPGLDRVVPVNVDVLDREATAAALRAAATPMSSSTSGSARRPRTRTAG